jgi:hypothetical protein
MSGEGHGWSLGSGGGGWFELFPGQVVNNLHTFAIAKKAQRMRGMFNLKCDIKA